MKKKLISLRGTYFPNFGGISVHLSRLADFLSKDGLLDCVYSTTTAAGFVENRFKVINVSYSWMRYGTIQSFVWVLRYWPRIEIVHINACPVWDSPSVFFLLLLGKRVVYTIHDEMMLHDVSIYPRILLWLFKKIIRHKNVRWIAVNNKIRTQIEKLNPLCSNISVIPAYLPSKSDDNPLNDEIEEFIIKRSKIIAIYAHSIREINGKDLYGIDLALKAIALVKKQYSEVGLIICLPNLKKYEKIDLYLSLINDLDLNENVLLFTQPVNNPSNLWRLCDAVLRPTLSDGDSLVVREALSQDTFVIASNVVLRPNGVVLFESENVGDLASKIIETLARGKMIANNSLNSNYKKILKAYYDL